MPKHIHADLIMEYAKIAQETDKPWEHFEYFQPDPLDDSLADWVQCRKPISFYSNFEYRLKPRTIRIGLMDVPEPVREPLELDATYYVPRLHSTSAITAIYRWDGVCFDNAMLERGFVHLDRESAEIHARALISLTQK
ncbi:hypothetical protein Xbed_03471 [Xenorhabdus beddingii]|uniref:Uncharacterized protein n=1 Tax=Xenorhabdus beddingii TaxID=40578 RepID=A0A1Y2SF08_9GAMM|nr:hypothetical protein [Xenorhabdus beddingii]OTA16544.1 hypothetical protein Xbed_03471 [Xenorhabdus beddingii]